MKVYIVMKYFSENYHVGNVYYQEAAAIKDADQDLMGLDYVAEREVKGTP